MGVLQDHAQGRLRRAFAKAETTFATYLKPTTADAFKCLSMEIKPEKAWEPRNDSRQTRSIGEEIPGKKKVTWKTEAYLLPSGSVGTAPDVDQLIKAAMGAAYAANGYALGAGQQAPGSLSLCHEYPRVVMEAASGAWVDKMTIKVDGGSEPRISFEGGAADYILTGNGKVGAIAAGAATAIVVKAGDREAFMINSVVSFKTPAGANISDGAGAGHTITAYDRTTGAATIAPGLTAGIAVDDLIEPFVPVETTAGSPVANVAGSLAIATVDLPFTGMEITLENQVKPFDDEALKENVTDYSLDWRKVNGQVSFKCRKDKVIEVGKAFNYIQNAGLTQAINLIIGPSAGKRWKVNVPYARITPTGLEPAESEELTYTLPFVARMSVGEDELNFLLD